MSGERDTRVQLQEMRKIAREALPSHVDLHLRPESYGEAAVLTDLALERNDPIGLWSVFYFILETLLDLDTRVSHLEGVMEDTEEVMATEVKATNQIEKEFYNLKNRIAELEDPAPRNRGYEVHDGWG